VDLVAAGFPCQGASVAGKRLGVDDERWLWPEVWRVVDECEASFLLFENVPGLLTVNRGEAFGQILDALASRGWVAEWDHVPAVSVGAPHVRDRLFVLAANPDRVDVRLEPERDQREGRSERKTECGISEPANARRDRRDPGPAVSDAMRKRRKANAHASGSESDAGSDTARGDLAHVVDEWRERAEWGRPPQPVLCRVDDGPADQLDETSDVDDPTQAARLHACGNAVVRFAAAAAIDVLWRRLTGEACEGAAR
jgi:DNA (cytosine-5)-methyltransferase 1